MLMDTPQFPDEPSSLPFGLMSCDRRSTAAVSANVLDDPFPLTFAQPDGYSMYGGGLLEGGLLESSLTEDDKPESG